jgi:hypothetical protein
MKILINVLLVVIGLLFLLLVYRALIIDGTTKTDHLINTAFEALILITLFCRYGRKGSIKNKKAAKTKA